MSSLVTLAALPAYATVNNDDSCDITTAPAATLLLPFFDVDLAAPAGAGDTTLFTITNTGSAPQIAHVTIWTDWAYPLLTFNLFLTGYDVQSINLYDVIGRGVVAPGGPGTSSTQNSISPNPLVEGQIAESGSEPDFNDGNPNIDDRSVRPGGSCAGYKLPGTLPPEIVSAVQTALTYGLYPVCGTRRIGGTHINARGYVTIDVVSECNDLLPTNPAYYSTMLYDNVLIGDVEQVHGPSSLGAVASANPLVHIRAVPEGGPAGSAVATNLPYTFYDRFTPRDRRKMDRRVPLPSRFAVRWIEDGTNLQTQYKIWREGVASGEEAGSCTAVLQNFSMPFVETISFDEHENSFAYRGRVTCSPICQVVIPTSPASLVVRISNTGFFPAHAGSPDVGGWLYLNLDHQPPASMPARPSQNWVSAVMYAQGRYAVEFDAAQLGNGCTPASPPSSRIGPGTNATP